MWRRGPGPGTPHQWLSYLLKATCHRQPGAGGGHTLLRAGGRPPKRPASPRPACGRRPGRTDCQSWGHPRPKPASPHHTLCPPSPSSVSSPVGSEQTAGPPPPKDIAVQQGTPRLPPRGSLLPVQSNFPAQTGPRSPATWSKGPRVPQSTVPGKHSSSMSSRRGNWGLGRLRDT